MLIDIIIDYLFALYAHAYKIVRVTYGTPDKWTPELNRQLYFSDSIIMICAIYIAILKFKNSFY